MNTDTCIIEPELSRDDFEICSGFPETEKECQLGMNYLYFLTKIGDRDDHTKRLVALTVDDLLALYMEHGRHIEGDKLCPRLIRNMRKEDSGDGCEPLSQNDMRLFRSKLVLLSSERYHASFPND